MQYASLAIAKELPVESMKITARGHIKLDLPRAFSDLTFEVRLEGSVSQDEAQSLARDASAHCFAENTLCKAIPVTTEVYLNKEKVLTSTHSPQ